jgi:hypothetical protein
MSAQQLAVAAIVVLGSTSLVALPDVIHGEGRKQIPAVELSNPIAADGAGDSGTEGDGNGSRVGERDGGANGHQPKSGTPGTGGRESSGESTGASTPHAPSSGPAPSAVSSGGYVGGGGEGGGGAVGGGSGGGVVDDQPAPASPAPAPPAVDDDGDVGGVDVDEVDDPPEAEVDDS